MSISEFYVAAFGTAVCISRMKFSTTNERHRHKHKHRQRDRQTKTASRQENSFCQRNSSIKHGEKNNKIAEHKKYAQLKFKNSSNNAKQFTRQRDSARTLCTDCAAERYKNTQIRIRAWILCDSYSVSCCLTPQMALSTGLLAACLTNFI